MYTIFFTVGNRNSTKISNYKNKKIMTNELSSFDEFNGFYSILVNNRLYMPPNEGIIGLYGPDFSKFCQATVGLIIQTMVSNII
jgi:hypothetical protein